MTRRSAINLTDKSSLDEEEERMAGVDITRDYFNSLNRMKKLPGYRDKCLSGYFEKHHHSPDESTEMLFLDDSGYISPEFLPITPFHFDIKDVSLKSSASSNHMIHSIKAWEETEEEDVEGKMQLRREIPKWKKDIHLQLECWNFAKKFSEMFDSNEHVIGKRIGRRNCDVISKLHKRNVSDFLTKLMGYMAPKDVSNMCLVSKDWLECCKTNHTAQLRLKELKTTLKVRRCKANKENIINVQPEQTKPKPKLVTKSELFKECANTLKKDECLQKCPKCDHPAKVRPVQERGVCMNNACGYHYCSKCRAKYHGSEQCYQVGTKRTTKEIVNTRKAKKYLRRL